MTWLLRLADELICCKPREDGDVIFICSCTLPCLQPCKPSQGATQPPGPLLASRDWPGPGNPRSAASSSPEPHWLVSWDWLRGTLCLVQRSSCESSGLARLLSEQQVKGRRKKDLLSRCFFPPSLPPSVHNVVQS